MEYTKEMEDRIRSFIENTEVGEITICINKIANKCDIIEQTRTRIKQKKNA